jgi:hypothetical protein
MSRPRSSNLTQAQLYEAVASAATLAERERCARVAEEFETHVPGTAWIMDAIAKAIRSNIAKQQEKNRD